MQFEEHRLNEKLTIRKVDQQVLNFVFSNYDDDPLKRFLGLGSQTELEAEKQKHRAGFSMFNKKILYFQILWGPEKQTIGWCGFHTWYFQHDRAEIGYGIFSDEFRNRGIMSEVIPRVIEYGFGPMDLNRIEAFAAEYNAPSIKLLEKMDFAREGVLKQHYCVDGRHEDSTVFALLRENYTAKR